jgi:hypothetical protein
MPFVFIVLTTQSHFILVILNANFLVAERVETTLLLKQKFYLNIFWI